MSASLVGSEMCIRDRQAPRPKSQRRGAPTVVARVRASNWLLRRCRAVSYTHLTLPTICSV
eukprot:5852299-Alexandrium_andersonii.AAC.1